MMVDIGAIKNCLFWWTPQVIDLDTGKIHSVQGLEIQGRTLGNSMIIPCHSKAPIYQQYLELLREKGVDVPKELFNWPRFEYKPRYTHDLNLNKTQESKFIDKAYDYLEFNGCIKTYTENDWSIPDFDEYADEIMLEFAKDWCRKQGFDWYDSRGKTANTN